jgi:hypothetical protein
MALVSATTTIMSPEDNVNHVPGGDGGVVII